MISPLLKPIQLEGGSFYTFPSASEDIGLTFADASNKFRFSKFALLDIPEIGNAGALYKNKINLSTPSGAFNNIDGSKTLNDYFIESFQNYCLNLETIITSAPNYSPTVTKTVSERVFFKWLKEIGAIRYKNAVVGETSSVLDRYTEEESSESYNRVVKYVGDINILNTVKNNQNTFTEVYIYIPGSHGYSPDILFSSVNDSNYTNNAIFQNAPIDPINNELLVNRTVTTIHPSGLDINAHFDSDNGIYSVSDPLGVVADYYYYDPITLTWIQAGNPGFKWWYMNPLANTYFLEPAFTSANNDIFKIESVNKSVEFKRSQLDGVSLAFQPTDYKYMNDKSYTEWGKFNEDPASGNFSFNAILVYYDLYNSNSNVIESTNLFGILFLDNVDPINSGGGKIPTLDKRKSIENINVNGNSYAFRLNLKFDLNTDDTAIETSINTYNPYSLELYMDVLNCMFRSSNILEDSIKDTNALKIQLDELKKLVLSSDSIELINRKLQKWDNIQQDNQSIFLNNKNIIDLINRNYTEIENIYKNKTSVNMQYNTELLQAGEGILLNNDSGKLVISNNKQSYKLDKKPLLDITTEFENGIVWKYWKPLEIGNNYFKIINGLQGSPFIIDKDIYIYIDDSVNRWKNGQSVKLAFEHGLELKNVNGTFFLYFLTDALDVKDTGIKWNVQCATINYLDFRERNGSPVIEIICLDIDNFIFTTDIF